MTFIPTPNAVRVVVKYAQGGQAFSNVFYFTKSSFTHTDMVNLAGAIDDFCSGWRASISDGITYVGTDVYDARSSTGEIVQDATGAGPGGLSGEELPISLAVVVTLRTSARGRSGRGRVYVSGFNEGGITDGIFTSTTGTNAKNYVDGILSAGSNQGFAMVVRSTQEDHVVQNPANTRTVTLTEVRSLLPGTQRRRIDRT